MTQWNITQWSLLLREGERVIQGRDRSNQEREGTSFNLTLHFSNLIYFVYFINFFLNTYCIGSTRPFNKKTEMCWGFILSYFIKFLTNTWIDQFGCSLPNDGAQLLFAIIYLAGVIFLLWDLYMPCYWGYCKFGSQLCVLATQGNKQRQL